MSAALKTVGRLRFVPKDLEPLCGYYATLSKEPLIVRAKLTTPYVPAEPDGSCHLDSILSWAVLAHLPYPVRTGGYEAPTVPLPLKLSWVRDGVPLWAVSDLRPQGDLLRDQAYWHKRYPTDQLHYMTKTRANVRAGKWKEYRIPMGTVVDAELRAVCVGNRGKLKELLAHVSHVGKKASQGYGRVGEWEVEPLGVPEEDAEEAALRARAVPLDYATRHGRTVEEGWRMYRGGWSAPYWFAKNHTAVVVREP